MSSKSKVSSVEILLSIAFLGIVIFFCYQMLIRQKRMVLRVNQNIEVTSVVYQLRDLLKGSGCRENLAGFSRVTPLGKINSLRSVVNFLDGTSTINEVFSVHHNQGGDWSETGLELVGFELNPRNLDQIVRSDRTYLVAHFKRKELDETLQQQIRIYTKDTNGIVTDCSLVPFTAGKEIWQQAGDSLVYSKGSVSIGVEHPQGRLSVDGGFYASPSLSQCGASSWGLIQYQFKSRAWTLCTRRGEISLLDERVFDE